MKKVFSLFILISFSLLLINACSIKKYFSKSEDRIFERDTLIKIDQKRDNVIKDFIFRNHDRIIENIEASSIADVFKENITESEIESTFTHISNLKTKEENYFEYKFGKPEGYGINKYKLTYNQNGFLESKNIPSNANDKYSESVVFYQYDDSKNIINAVCKNSNSESLYTITYIYNKYGKLIEEFCKVNINKPQFEAGEKINKFRSRLEFLHPYFHIKHMEYHKTIRYNDSNNITEEIDWDENGNIKNKKVYNYDNFGNFRERIVYANLNKKVAVNSKTIIYNKSIELIYYFGNDTINHRQLYSFDDDFRLIEKRRVNSQNNIDWKILYTYVGNVVSKIKLLDFDKSKNRNILIKYSDSGKRTEEILFDCNEKALLTLIIIFDDQGNIIERKLLDDKNLIIFKHVFRYSNNILTEKIEYDNLNEPKKLFQYNYAFY